ncbi:MAG: hypothetical protein Q4F23_07125, partial [Coriobacteriia bacterium]|nr:hypothetical protein [Coriobacteriia bacterium]
LRGMIRLAVGWYIPPFAGLRQGAFLTILKLNSTMLRKALIPQQRKAQRLISLLARPFNPFQMCV